MVDKIKNDQKINKKIKKSGWKLGYLFSGMEPPITLFDIPEKL